MAGILLLVLLAAMAGCKERKPSFLPSEREMEALLYDYHLAHSLAKLSKDSAEYLSDVYAGAVLQKHGLTAEEFDSAMAWYGRNTETLAAIYTRLDTRLKGEITLMGELASNDADLQSLPTSGDTANIWTGSSHYILAHPGLHSRLEFKIESDTLFRAKDRIEWHFAPHFVLPQGGREATVSLTLRYADGSTTTRTMRMHAEKEFALRIDANKNTPQSVEGFLLLSEGGTMQKQKLLCLSDISLVRMHTIAAETDKIEMQAPGDSTAVDSLQTATIKADTLPRPVHKRPTPVGRRTQRNN